MKSVFVNFIGVFLTLTVLSFNLSAQSKILVNADDNGVMIEGYDPISFFHYNEVKGSSEFQSKYEGGIYYFANAANKAKFDAHPYKYIPQFGGYCAYAILEGKLKEIEIWSYQIINGKLIFNHNKKAFELWSSDVQGNMKKAEENWPGLFKKFSKKS